MTETIDAKEFQQRMLGGSDEFKTIVLEADGLELEGVEMHVVGKGQLSRTVEALPDEILEADTYEVDEDITAEEAEEIAAEEGSAKVTESMYNAFEELCTESLKHKDLTNVQMGLIVEEFAFELVFELGSEILTYSLENSGAVTGFREQQ